MKKILHAIVLTSLLLPGCDATAPDAQPNSPSQPAAPTQATASDEPATTVAEKPLAGQSDAERRDDFASYVRGQLIDTDLHELKGALHVMIVNPNQDDESPLSSQPAPEFSAPGPHLHSGVLHADIEQLRAILGDDRPVTIEDLHVYVGNPERKIIGHKHGDALYVPARLFARQYGAYLRVSSTLGNDGWIWTAEILDYMKKYGSPQAAGLLEAHADGIISDIDVRAPAGN